MSRLTAIIANVGVGVGDGIDVPLLSLGLEDKTPWVQQLVYLPLSIGYINDDCREDGAPVEEGEDEDNNDEDDDDIDKECVAPIVVFY